MQLQLALIGLGEIGASVGLALRYQKKELIRIGLDSLEMVQEMELLEHLLTMVKSVLTINLLLK